MSIRSSLAVAALVSSLSASAFAQGPANTDPVAVKPGVYAIEPTHTRVLFAVNHMGFTTWYGDFTHASGELRLDPTHPAMSHLLVSVPVESVSTTNARLDGELKSGDWFDAGKYPTATFSSTKITRTGPGDAEVAGALTLHGVTRPVVLHAHFNGSGDNMMSHIYTVGFEASGEIRRSDFGVSKYVPLVGDQVKLIISAAFEKAPG